MNALMNLNDYPLAGFYDELIDSDHRPRPAARQLFDYLSRFTPAELHERRAAVDAAITSMVAGGASGTTAVQRHLSRASSRAPPTAAATGGGASRKQQAATDPSRQLFSVIL